MEKGNYPIKYALLPVKEFKINDMGKEYETIVCYIVSKAYVVEEYKVHHRDGSYSTTYKVCFPNTFYARGINPFRKTPDSHLSRDNEMVVSKLFDDYETAKAYRDERNVFVPEDKLDVYIKYEDEVSRLTDDLIVVEDKPKLLIKQDIKKNEP